MIKHFKYALYLIVLIGYSSSISGSYEDYFRAIKFDDVAVVKGLLARGFDPNTPSPNGEFGLQLAINEGSSKVLAVLLAEPQIRFNAASDKGETPLMLASLKGLTDAVKQLIALGADVNKPGWTPLHYAATHGHLAVMSLLLEHHAYIDAESPNGSTPLMMAAMYGTPESVKLLLESDADPLLRNQLGLTALEFARRADRKDAVSLIEAFLKTAQSAKPQ